MRYSESSSKSKFTGSAAFYIVIACCLIAIGGASWFAISILSSKEAPSQSSSQSSKSSSDNNSANIGSIKEPSAVIPSTDVAEPVKNEPYASSSSEEKTETPPVANTFSMPIQGDTAKNYSENELQYSATYGDMRIHSGIDIACENGTAVSSCGKGTVLSVEESSTLGNVVTIDHGNGIVIKYSNIEEPKIAANDKVDLGDIIGSTGTIPSECADQSHLHMEVYKDGHLASPLATLGLE